MDPKEAGRLGGRPTKMSKVISASGLDTGQRKLVFTGGITFSGPVTFKGAVNIGAGAGAFAGSGGGGGGSAKRKLSASGGGGGGGRGGGGGGGEEGEGSGEEAEVSDEDEFEGEDEGEGSGEDADEEDGEDEGDEGAEAAAALQLISALPDKRRGYSMAVKNEILKVLDALGGNVARTIRLLRQRTGYASLTRQSVMSWRRDGTEPKVRTGRPVVVDFERRVLGRLMYTVLNDVNDPESATVVANVAHSYEIIKLAGKTEQQEALWAENPTVQKLQFSSPWVVGFLSRATLHRRRVTTVDKSRPSVPEVQEHMRAIQARITAGPPENHLVGLAPVSKRGYPPLLIINADETASRYAPALLNQYVPTGTDRGSAPEFDESARFTSMLAGTASGVMLPTFNIIKCTVDKPDLRSSTVIASLHKQAGYRVTDGWALKTWERKLVLKIKGVNVEQHYHRPYLLHAAEGTVITTQHNAWMDSVGMCMWTDLLIGPWVKAHGGYALLVWDSCGPHKVAAVRDVFDAWNIALEKLPVCMTDILQVMDLIVNGPLKAQMRRFRCASLFAYFQKWKLQWVQELLKPAASRVMPPFQPPKPSLIDGLNLLRAVAAELFSKPAFKESMVATFVKVGLAQDPKAGEFLNYTSHSRSKMPALFAPADSPTESQFTLGNVAAELDYVPRSLFDDAEDD